MPVTKDPRYVDTCARISCYNVKVGKAKNLAARQKNYWKDFGRDNVEFIPIVLTENIQEAETAILRHLRDYRKKSPKGGVMDWLENIEFGMVIEEALRALKACGIQHEVLVQTR